MCQLDFKKVLYVALRNLISSDYILLDLPYFDNVGDIMIWQATLDILKNIPHKCRYSSSIETYHKVNIPNNTLIIFMGGGNYGDLWEHHQIFRKKVMQDYPENPVLQLPQSVCFVEKKKLLDDIAFMDGHRGGMTICLRDKASYDLIKKDYKRVTPILLPDMALSLDITDCCRRNGINPYGGEGNLFVRRQDKECSETSEILNKIPQNSIVSDWPVMIEKKQVICKYEKYLNFLMKIRASKKMRDNFTNFYYKYVIKDYYITEGIRFLAPYRNIYTTRLHAAILGFLMNKNVYIIDNSYGKCSGVYEEWLRTYSNIRMI